MDKEKARSAAMVVHTYKYMFRDKHTPDGNIGVRFITDTVQGHDEFIAKIVRDDNIIQCVREYVCSYDCCLIGMVYNIKNKEEVKVSE